MGGSVYTSLRPRSVIRFDYFCLSEPKINASDQIILPLDGSIKPVLLKCNLTTAQTPHKDSFWMKNGQEITNTRSEQKNTTYRWQTLTLSLLSRAYFGKRKNNAPSNQKKIIILKCVTACRQKNNPQQVLHVDMPNSVQQRH